MKRLKVIAKFFIFYLLTCYLTYPIYMIIFSIGKMELDDGAAAPWMAIVLFVTSPIMIPLTLIWFLFTETSIWFLGRWWGSFALATSISWYTVYKVFTRPTEIDKYRNIDSIDT